MTYKILRSFALIEYEDSAGNRSQLQSNITSSLLTPPPIRLICSASLQQACVGDIFSYQFLLLNEGNHPVSDLYLIDHLPPCLKYISHSICSNDTFFDGLEYNLFTAGLYLGSLEAGCHKMITFNVKLLYPPCQNTLENIGECAYIYPSLSDPCQLFSYTAYSNPSYICVMCPQLSLKLSCPSSCYVPAKPVTYCLQLCSTGNVPAYSPRLQLSLSTLQAAFLPNSLIINGQMIHHNPFSSEFRLPALPPGSCYYIHYSIIPGKHCSQMLHHSVCVTYYNKDSTKPLKAESAACDLFPSCEC